MSISKEITESCKEHFSMHKATLIQDTERYFAVDWRKGNGSGDYYVNYILDKKRGSLIISGDLGDCIATWYNPTTPEKIKSYIRNNPDYFLSKVQCATNDYTHYEEDVLKDIKDRFEKCEYDVRDYGGSDLFIDDEEEFWHKVKDEVSESCSRCSDFRPTKELEEIIREFDSDYYGWLYSCGERIAMRVYLWIIGFEMALDQLGL